MAKKKPPEDEMTTEQFSDLLFAEVDKEFGDVLVSGSELADEPKTTIPMSTAMDMITSGGIMEGSWVGITGNPKLGKTVLALTLAANCQKPEYGSRPIFYGNVEGRIGKMHLTGIKGLDLSPGKFTIIRSRKGKILSGPEHLKIYEMILKTIPNAVLIIDSISCLCEQKEADEGAGVQSRGGGAKMFSQFCRTMNNVVPVNNSIVVGITHLICNTGGMGAGMVERAARMWMYQCDYQLRGIRKSDWIVGDKRIGQKVEWLCNTSRTGPPGMKIESCLRYGVGFDSLYEIIEFGSDLGVIKKSGSWFTIDFDTGNETWNTLKWQGGEKLYQFLLETPDLVAKLREQVMVNSGSLPAGGNDASEGA